MTGVERLELAAHYLAARNDADYRARILAEAVIHHEPFAEQLARYVEARDTEHDALEHLKHARDIAA